MKKGLTVKQLLKAKKILDKDIKENSDILKAVELDEEKIINILLSRTDYGINSCYKIAKAIVKGDVWKGGREVKMKLKEIIKCEKCGREIHRNGKDWTTRLNEENWKWCFHIHEHYKERMLCSTCSSWFHFKYNIDPKTGMERIR